MIRVNVGNNLGTKPVPVDENSTIREVLEDNKIAYDRGVTTLSGRTLIGADLDKTFADFGVTESCFLLNVVKADNA